MRESRCFVQFIHPGGEHRPDSPGLKSWNVGSHKRKFLKSPGRYFLDGREHDGDVVFWGEWEAESSVEAFVDPGPEEPRYLNEPYLVVPDTKAWRQNTDPFVFGDHFCYTGCLQHAGGRPTQLRHLERGSLLLFGSCVGRLRFVLDTVFVADQHVDHGPLDHESELEGVISETYRLTTIEPMYLGEVAEWQTFRLYFGATPSHEVAGMFSFFPCRPYERGSFARPEIRMPGLITPHLLQGKKIRRDVSLDEQKNLWDEVVRQVTEQGLALGVHVALPPTERE